MLKTFILLIIFSVLTRSKEILKVYVRGNAKNLAYVGDDDYHQEKKQEPYHFGYDIRDHENNFHWHKEESDNQGTKTGSYGYRDADGLYRHVDYIADHNGFRVHIKTNEPGTSNSNPASVKIEAERNPLFQPEREPEQIYPRESKVRLPLLSLGTTKRIRFSKKFR